MEEMQRKLNATVELQTHTSFLLTIFFMYMYQFVDHILRYRLKEAHLSATLNNIVSIVFTLRNIKVFIIIIIIMFCW